MSDINSNELLVGFEMETDTRAPLVDLDFMQKDPNGFKVYAHYNNPVTDPFIDNLNYRYESGLWDWVLPSGQNTPAWPENGAQFPIQFYAVYSPSAYFSDPLTMGTITAMDFDTKSAAIGSGTNEIMVAKKACAAMPEGGIVPLSFKHALSKVRFAVTTGAGLTAKIQSISLVHVASKRSFSMVNGTYSGAPNSSVSFDYLTFRNTNTLSGIKRPIEADNSGALFMIPQDTEPWKASPWDASSLDAGARVEVVYRLSQGTQGSPGYQDLAGYGAHATEGEVFVKAGYPLDLNASPWEMGSAYCCTINLGTVSDNGGILVNDKFYTSSGVPTAVDVIRPTTNDKIDIGTPILVTGGDKNIGFSTMPESWETQDGGNMGEDNTKRTIVFDFVGEWKDVPQAGESKEVLVTGANWTTSVIGDGLTITPTEGLSGSKATLKWDVNTQTSGRSARAIFSANGNGFGSDTIKTNQLSSGFVLSSAAWLDAVPYAALHTLKVLGDDWTATVALETRDAMDVMDANSILSIDKAAGVNGDVVNISWLPNYGTANEAPPATREGTVTFTSAAGSRKVVFKTSQRGESMRAIKADGTIFKHWDADPAGDTVHLYIAGAIAWNAKVGNAASGLTIRPVSGRGITANKKEVKQFNGGVFENSDCNPGYKHVIATWTPNSGDPAPADREDKITITATSGGEGTLVFTTKQKGSGPTPPPLWVDVNGVKWATGNLVAESNNACKIGLPTDGGLYFQYGSLIGWSGGSLSNGGNGVGAPITGWDGKFFGGATVFDISKEMAVWPLECTTLPTAFPASGADKLLNKYHYNYIEDDGVYGGKSLTQFNPLSRAISVGEGGYADKGIGDPCNYYLGVDWRLPVRGDEIFVIQKDNLKGAWLGIKNPEPGGDDIFGRWVGFNPLLTHSSAFIPASGIRASPSGSFSKVMLRSALTSTANETQGGATSLTFEVRDNYAVATLDDKANALPARCIYIGANTEPAPRH